MKTRKPEKRVPHKSNGEFFDYDEFPQKSKAKKPKRGRKDYFSDDDNNDGYEDDDNY